MFRSCLIFPLSRARLRLMCTKAEFTISALEILRRSCKSVFRACRYAWTAAESFPFKNWNSKRVNISSVTRSHAETIRVLYDRMRLCSKNTKYQPRIRCIIFQPRSKHRGASTSRHFFRFSHFNSYIPVWNFFCKIWNQNYFAWKSYFSSSCEINAKSECF